MARSSIIPTPTSASPTVALTCSSWRLWLQQPAFGLLGAQQGIMSLEQAVRRLTFESASGLGSTIADCCGPAWRPTSRSSILTPSTRCRRMWCMIFPPVLAPEGARHRRALHDRQWPSIDRRRAPYRSAAGTRPQEYVVSRAVPRSNCRRPRVPPLSTQERGACWGGNSGARWPGMWALASRRQR